MIFFEEAALRLKQQLKVHSDKEAAALLGLSAVAWVGRKNRNNFPEKELRALAQTRPDLKLDVHYVLTGEKQSEAWLKNFPARLAQVRAGRSYAEFAPLMGATVEDVVLIEAGAQMPTKAQFVKLVESHPSKSPVWIAGGEAPKLAQPLDDLEVVLITNYRANSPRDQAALRKQAAGLAGEAVARTKAPAPEIDLVADPKPNRKAKK